MPAMTCSQLVLDYDEAMTNGMEARVAAMEQLVERPTTEVDVL